jgi:hypothetical protein
MTSPTGSMSASPVLNGSISRARQLPSSVRASLRALIAAAMSISASALLAQPPAQAETGIAWKVENPFRFFTDPIDTEVHRATFESLTDDERRTPVLSAERALSERHSDGWAATMVRKTCWTTAKNRFGCPEVADYIRPKAHKVRVEAIDIPDGDTIDCTWLTAPIGGRARGTAITKACNAPVELMIPYPAGAKVILQIGTEQVASQNVVVQDLFIVGLGDSFGSGEGNPDVPVRLSPDRTAEYGDRSKEVRLDGYPARVGAWEKVGDAKFLAENARWLDQACHRSLYSHQLRAALQLAVEDPHRAVTYAGVACSGAETTFGLFLRYKGNEWVPNPPELSQISAIAEAMCGTKEARPNEYPEAYHMGDRVPELKGGLVLRKCEQGEARPIDLIFLSIGGNDIGFSRLVANAVLADQSSLRSLGGWFGQVYGFAQAQTQLNALEDRYKALNRAFHNILHMPWPEADRVIMTGYPPMTLLEDGKSVCPDGRAGMDVLPDFQLSEAKAREGDAAAARLHNIMIDSAKQHRWTIVEAHRAQFRGRGICAGWTGTALNSVDDLRIPRKIDGKWEPYNPAEWKPYASRQRWFRTPNDAFLTGNFHVTASALQNVLKAQGFSWVQLLLASTYSGAFHPTAEGHAAIADAVVDKARGVLDRYPQAAVVRTR